jgi:beta-glucosidase
MHSSGTLARRLVAVAGAGLAAAAIAAPVVNASGNHTTRAARPPDAAPLGGAMPYQNPQLPIRQRVQDLLSRMTLAEKIGQMTQTERGSVDTDTSKITTDNLGSLLSGGGSVPMSNTPTAWADMVDRYQRAALRTRLHIPLIYGIDTVHGDGNMDGATVFPTTSASARRAIRRSCAPWSTSPPRRRGRCRSGSSPRVCPSHAMTGGAARTSPSAKTRSSCARWRPPYVTAVRQHDIGSAMPSDSDVDWTEDGLGNPINMHGNRDLITGWLKDRMGFGGFVISAYNGIDHINPTTTTTTFSQKVQAGVNAGIDMFMQPQNFEQFESTLTDLVNAGQVPMGRINDAVSRILTKKFQLGLFEHPFTDRRYINQVGSAAHHAVARRAAAESQVLLKNRRQVLPIERHSRIYVAGSNADSIGNQGGGWTLTWQGGSTNVIPGTTILDGIRQDARGGVTYSPDASAPIPHNATGIVVVGETPYSEGFSDVFGPQWAFDPGDNGVPRPVKDMQLSAADKAAVDKVCTAAKRCVMVIVSGRPLILDPAQRHETDEIVAAWLPGSEGTGVADTLFGERPFTGQLPVSWPRSLAQEPINVGDPHYNPLYPFGYGLTTHVGRSHGRRQ